MAPVDTVEVAHRDERPLKPRRDIGKIVELDHRRPPLGLDQSGGPTVALEIDSGPSKLWSRANPPVNPVGLFDPLRNPAVLTFSAGYVTTWETMRDRLGCPSRERPKRLGRSAGCHFDREPGLADALIAQTGYFGIFLVLVLGGLGLPVPEEAPIILAAILARKGTMHWIPALGSCFAGVLVGDFIVYFLGFFYGEKVLSLPLTRKFLTKAREAQIKGYFHRHGVKILVLGRFAVGFRTAAYLTAGILRLPPLKLFFTDLCAATFSTLLMFGLGYAFASKVEEGFQEAKHYITPAIALGLVVWFLHRYVKARMMQGQAVGPPVLVEGDVPLPLPPDDLHVHLAATPPFVEPCPELTAAPGRSQVIPGVNVASTADPAIELEAATAPGPALAPSEPG